MSDLGRLFIALLLSLAAVFGWNAFYVAPKLKAKQEAEALIKAQQPAPAAIAATTAPAPSVIAAADIAVASSAKLTREEALADKTSRVKIDAGTLHGSINLVGGMIDDATLADYREEQKEGSPEVILLSPRNTKSLYFVNSGWISANTATPDDNSRWQLESGRVLTPTTPVTIRFSVGGVTYRKIFSIDEKYLITVNQSVENHSGKMIEIAPFGLINRTFDTNQGSEFVSHVGFIAVTDKKLNEADYKDVVGENAGESFRNVSGWIGMGDKYWLTSIIPQNSATGKFDIAFKHYNRDGIDRFQADILAGNIQIEQGAKAEYSFNMFTGAKKLKFIEKHEEALNIDLFDRAIDFGSLYFLTKPIFKMLAYFHEEIGNMGLAIMLLTVCIRLVLFPLANMSFKSMARMKKHMPEITKLKDKFKNDRQKQGQEMMRYYKEHRINPAAGCLPVLLQIPVFFALYKVLYVTIEMRHEPFFWFVTDLSAKDPTNLLTLFGLVVWSVPSWLPHIGILPILFSLTMVVQQKLNPPMADETQKLIMTWMPWIFLFVFANFASGLVIYWIWNNILSIIQQAVITRRIEEDKNE